MPNEQGVAESVLEQYSVKCQHIGGQQCFVPTNAVRSFVDQCKAEKLVMAHGDVYAPQDGLTPVVVMLPDAVYKAVAKLAAQANVSIPELTAHCLVSVLGKEDVVDTLSSILLEKMDTPPDPGLSEVNLSPQAQEGSSESWSFNLDQEEQTSIFKLADRSDDEPGSDVELPMAMSHGSDIPKDNGSNKPATQTQGSASSQVIYQIKDKLQPLAEALSYIHSQRTGPVDIIVSFSELDRSFLNIRYPTDGYDIVEEYAGSLERCVEEITDRLKRWSSVAFAPKLQSGQSAGAKVQVEIVEFDKTKGKYKAKIGGAEVWLDPELVGQV